MLKACSMKELVSLITSDPKWRSCPGTPTLAVIRTAGFGACQRAAVPTAWRIAPMNQDERVMARRLARQAPIEGYVVGDGNCDDHRLHPGCVDHGEFQRVRPRRRPDATAETDLRRLRQFVRELGGSRGATGSFSPIRTENFSAGRCAGGKPGRSADTLSHHTDAAVSQGLVDGARMR
jgi:hypothetical protein